MEFGFAKKTVRFKIVTCAKCDSSLVYKVLSDSEKSNKTHGNFFFRLLRQIWAFIKFVRVRNASYAKLVNIFIICRAIDPLPTARVMFTKTVFTFPY